MEQCTVRQRQKWQIKTWHTWKLREQINTILFPWEILLWAVCWREKNAAPEREMKFTLNIMPDRYMCATQCKLIAQFASNRLQPTPHSNTTWMQEECMQIEWNVPKDLITARCQVFVMNYLEKKGHGVWPSSPFNQSIKRWKCNIYHCRRPLNVFMFNDRLHISLTTLKCISLFCCNLCLYVFHTSEAFVLNL